MAEGATTTKSKPGILSKHTSKQEATRFGTTALCVPGAAKLGSTNKALHETLLLYWRSCHPGVRWLSGLGDVRASRTDHRHSAPPLPYKQQVASAEERFGMDCSSLISYMGHVHGHGCCLFGRPYRHGPGEDDKYKAEGSSYAVRQVEPVVICTSNSPSRKECNTAARRALIISHEI